MLQVIQQAGAAAPSHASAFYLDWTFWQWIIASLALILSQLPPLSTFLRRGRLKLDVPAKIAITHKVGNPNVSMIMSMRNVGGAEVRIKQIRLRFTRNKTDAFQVIAQHFEFLGSPNVLLFVPFTLGPKERWSYTLGFYTELERQVDKEFRANRLAMLQQIRERLAKRPKAQSQIPVKVDAALVEPFNKLFEKQFRWLPGEYEMEVTVDTTPSSAALVQRYRFTLFESDTQELREHKDEFELGGGGITFASEHTTTIFAPLEEIDPKRK